MLSATLASASLSSMLRGDVSEQEAIHFFEDSYRSAYLRLLVFVSAFYKLYDGKETIFWMAQQLSHQDADGTNLKSAFTNLVSGVADLKDVNDQGGEAARRLVLEEMAKRVEENVALRKDKQAMLAIIEEDAQRVHENDAFFNKIRGIDPLILSPENAIQGLYVVTKPHLGLARVNIEKEYPTA
jgi:hypothetical protein